jgi:hypothetical protein
MIKVLKKLGVEGICLSIINVIYGKPTANIILSEEKLKSWSLKSGKTRVSTLPILIQYNTGIPIQSNMARERNKRDSNREGRSQIISR